VLAFLPPFPPGAVEVGLQQFLDRLEFAGQGLSGERDEEGLWPWLVAGTAVVVACEMARRQWRRPDCVPVLAGDGVPGAVPAPPFPE
jgi:hypothetical protein